MQQGFFPAIFPKTMLGTIFVLPTSSGKQFLEDKPNTGGVFNHICQFLKR